MNMNNYTFCITILFISINVITLFSMLNTRESKFTDVEKVILNDYCKHEDILSLGQTNRINHERAHSLIQKNMDIYLTNLYRTFHNASNLEEKMGILENGLYEIAHAYIQHLSDSYTILKNQKPNIPVLIATVKCVNNCILDELNTEIIDRYTNERYATILWKFLRSIMESAHISKKDRKKICRSINKKVKKLKVAYCLPDYPRTIEYFLRKKIGSTFCTII